MVHRHAQPHPHIGLSFVLSAALVSLPGCSDGERTGGVDISAPERVVEPVAETPPKVMIIGLDGADLRNIMELSEGGRLPHLSGLMSRGTVSSLETVGSISPMIWTSVATGVVPEKHGIEFFRDGDQEPAASTMRRRPAFWNILTHYERSVGVLGWWATFPAEQVRGYMVTPYILLMPPRGTKSRIGRLWNPGDPRKSHPPSLLTGLADVMYRDSDIDLSRMGHIWADREKTTNTAWVLAKDWSYYEMAMRLLRSDPVDVVAVYYQGIDAASHDFERHVRGPNVNEVRPSRISPEETRAAMDRVRSMYEYHDRLIGGLLAHASADTDVIVLSDHGWEYDGTSHWNNTPGVFIAAGPSFAQGRGADGLSVLDVTPVVLAILGVPLSRDFDGKIPEGLLRDDIVAGVRWVDEYPIPAVALPEDVDSLAPEDELMLEHLKSLGYVK